MKQFYLIGNDDGVRFIPSVGLHYSIPCTVYGELFFDENLLISDLVVRKFNEIIKKDLEDE